MPRRTQDSPNANALSETERVAGRDQPPTFVDVFRPLLTQRIIVPNEAEVAGYLGLYSDLAHLLPPICSEVRRAFGPEVELSFELRRDPEFEDRQLTLYVRKDAYEPEILERLHSVSERFNSKLEEVGGDFLLATDFAKPRGQHAV